MRNLLLFMALLSSTPAFAADTVVVVVRHAEKAQDDPRDPSLSAAGLARATALAEALASSRLQAVFATQFRRTQLTGKPSAAANGIELKVLAIDATVERYATDLRQRILDHHTGQTVLVIGHSNTVPEIVEVLSGQASEPMPESEFDRLSVVILPEDGGPARLLVARY